MTDSEIVKALECCKKKGGNSCKKCPLYFLHSPECINVLSKSALDLINRLQEENEELVGNIDKLKAELFDKTEQLNVELQAMRGAANSYKAENEKLKKEKDEYAYLYDKHINTAFSRIKAEAYEEFIDKFLEKAISTRNYFEIKSLARTVLNELVGDGGCDTCKSLTCDGCELYEELVGEDNASKN